MTSLAMEGLKNNINNYKGVMLCTRPNENIGVTKERPFVSRVDPKAQLGINPVRKPGVVVERRRVNPVLQRHRAWLETFKQKVRERKEDEEIKVIVDREKFDRVRDNASKSRSQANAEDYEINVVDQQSNNFQSNAQPEQSSPVHVEKKQEEARPPKPVVAPKKKENKVKPKWAYTEEQIKAEEDEDVDDLLNFTANLDYDKYIDDLEVKHMVNALKNRIDELKSQEDNNWKEKIVDQWNNEGAKDPRKSVQPSKVDLSYDARSDARSVASESRSVASERSNKSITELKAKLEAKEKKDWDALSTTTKKNQVSVEERIAKHVADEILRNNTQFKHFHSNASVRKILEKEAQKHLEEGAKMRGPEIVSNKEYFMRKDIRDPNNLPYLHRNPAI